jgi:catechol 2,3-dioxygenase-like lactoylglutathione lyase family enzyme
MITAIIPRLPARDIAETEKFYQEHLDFETVTKLDDYLILSRNGMELHFYQNRVMNVQKNNTMLYVRVDHHIQELHEKAVTESLPLTVLGKLEEKPWGEIEFSLLDPSHNLLTFGQPMQRS